VCDITVELLVCFLISPLLLSLAAVPFKIMVALFMVWSYFAFMSSRLEALFPKI
jgi:hypothetical protein